MTGDSLLTEQEVLNTLRLDSNNGDVFYDGYAELGLMFVVNLKVEDRGVIPR